MTRIVAGRAGGRRLVVPAGAGTRPTSDRAREGLFSTLVALTGSLAGARVLDLYAGSGALGLEALSRGADAATLVESNPSALRALRSNVAAVGLPGAVVVPERVERWIAGLAGTGPVATGYDVVLADPPYSWPAEVLAGLLADLVAAGALVGGRPDPVVAVERSSRDPEFPWPPGWTSLRTRRYGEATFWYGRPA